MKINKLNIIIFIGLIAIVGVLFMQLLMLNKAYDFEKKEYGDKIYFALQDVVYKIYRDNNIDLPITDQIKKVTEDYYIVNVDDVFEASVLEYYLKTEFQKVKLDIDFEYAIYDCDSDEMVYGNYIASANKSLEQCENCFEKKEGLIYYFVVRFPNLKYAYIGSLNQYWMYTFILILVLIIYVYSVILLVRQRKYSGLQKDFINNMTHEFKTPLSSILIASRFAEKQKAISEDTKLSKYIGIIIQQSEKLNLHIERILNVAKSDTQWIQLEKNHFNLFETLMLIQENAMLKYHDIPEIKIKINEQIFIQGDAFHLYNVFFNIVENAIKYGPSIPKISITTSEIKNKLVLCFTDNGPGIDNRHLDYIFDKFYRVPRANNKEIEGFGIGLSYVKKILDLHQWQIQIRNHKPHGLSVYISIPKKDIQ